MVIERRRAALAFPRKRPEVTPVSPKGYSRRIGSWRAVMDMDITTGGVAMAQTVAGQRAISAYFRVVR
jgi:hypothetical protein